MQQIINCQQRAQAERVNDPHYRQKRYFPRVIQHDFPPDQFLTSESGIPPAALQVPATQARVAAALSHWT